MSEDLHYAMCRSMNVQTKSEALRLMACIIQGLGDRDRNVLSIQADALKAAVRTGKEATSPETCIAAAGERMLQNLSCRAASVTHEALTDIDRKMLSIDLLGVAVLRLLWQVPCASD